MKYIVFQEPSGLEFPVLFPDRIDHSFIRNSVNAEYPGVKAIRAGFCNSNGACWGNSVSLKLSSNTPEDEYLLAKTFDKDWPYNPKTKV